MNPKFQFGNVVVVEVDQIGVIVKSWKNNYGGYDHDVYVRSYSYNSVKCYPDDEIKHFVYSKELSEEECEFYE